MLQAIRLYHGFLSSACISTDLALELCLERFTVGTYGGWRKVRYRSCSLLDFCLDNGEMTVQHMLHSITHMDMPRIAIVQVEPGVGHCWDMQLFCLIISFGLLKIVPHGHGTYVGGTSSLPRCSGSESVIYSFTKKLDFSAVLNMDECYKIRFSYKNYMIT